MRMSSPALEKHVTALLANMMTRVHLLSLEVEENDFSQQELYVMDCVATISELYFMPSSTLVISLPKNINKLRFPTLTKRTLDGLYDNSLDFEMRLLLQLHQRRKWKVVISRITGKYRSYEYPNWDPVNDDRHASYVILTYYDYKNKNEILYDVRWQLEVLQILSGWNPKARFLLVVKGIVDISKHNIIKVLLTELWKINVINVVIQVQERNEQCERINIYSWFPFNPPSGACGEINQTVLLDTWVSNNTKGKFIHDTNLFPPKVPTKLDGCQLRTSVGEFPPYVIYENRRKLVRNYLHVSGFDLKMIETIAQSLHMNLKVKPMFESYVWGKKAANGTWGGLRGELIYKKADVVMDAWSNNLNDHLLFQDTQRYYTDRVTWYVPKGMPNPRWMSIGRVFTTTTWVILFLCIFISALVMWVFSTRNASIGMSQSYKHILHCISDSWAVVLSVSVSRLPILDSLRIIFISYVIYSLAINNIFQTFFTSYLIDPGLEHEISNVVELVRSKLSIYLSIYLSIFFDETLLKDQNRRHILDTPYDCLEVSIKSSNIATMLSRAYAISQGKELLEEEHKAFPFTAFKDDVLNNHIVMMVQKGSPYLDLINDIIIHLVEGGFSGKYVKDILDHDQHQSSSRSMFDLADEYVPMSVSHLQSAFILLGIGTVLAIISFAAELVRKIYKNTRKYKVKAKRRIVIGFHNIAKRT